MSFSLREFISNFNRQDAHPFAQFIKYAISGGLSSVIHLVVFFLAAWMLFPALTATDPFVRLFDWLGVEIAVPELSDKVRSNRVMLDNGIAFLFSNTVAYLLNILWVFRRGRHSWLYELALFYGVSGFSVVVGTALAGGLVRWTGIETTYAFAANILASVAINYVARKFYIFKG